MQSRAKYTPGICFSEQQLLANKKWATMTGIPTIPPRNSGQLEDDPMRMSLSRSDRKGHSHQLWTSTVWVVYSLRFRHQRGVGDDSALQHYVHIRESASGVAHLGW